LQFVGHEGGISDLLLDRFPLTIPTRGELIASGFGTALKTGVAVGFHIDDSMFWGRLKELNTPGNIG
jgi:hypothetical protein